LAKLGAGVIGEMKRFFSRSGLLFCLFLILGGSQSAHAQYRFDHWTTDNGLPQNSVHGTLQTSDGYMWFTTYDGLARFDGVRFTVFNKSNSTGLPSNQFNVVYEDRKGDLWATLNTGGIVRMHRGRFTAYNKGEGLPFDVIYMLTDDGQRNPIFSWGKNLFHWREEQFQPFNELPLSIHQPPDDRSDRLPPVACWYEGDKLFCFANGRQHSWALTELPVLADIYGATTGESGDFWFSSPRGLVHVMNGRPAQIYNETNGLPGMNPALVWGRPRPLQAFSRDAAGSLWLTDLDSMQSRLLSRETPNGWDVNYDYGGFADNEGNYWFGSNGNGLFRAGKQTINAYGKAQGLNAREVNSLLEARDGSIWIGTRRDGLFRFKDGEFTHYTGADSFGEYVTSLYEDRAGQLWVNAYNSFWRFTKQRFIRETWKEVANSALGGVWTMCEDRAGAYWVGCQTGVIDYQNGVATQYTTKDGLAADDTRVIITDSAGGLWLGGEGGITHYSDGKFTAWTGKDGLPGATVRALKLDGDGTLWIGTYDSGLGRFKDGRFTSYAKKDGMYDDGVFQILEDDDGWFWMSCNRGVYRVRKQELNDFADGKTKTITSLAYTKSDGMPSSECSSGKWPAGIKTRDAKLWFPTLGGVAVIDPLTVRFNNKPPPVLIEEMRINNQPVEIDRWETANRDPEFAIKVEPGQQDFEIRYTAVSFINSENLKFKYKLEGLDHEWIDAGTRRTAHFSHVPAGDYTFKVIAANSDGIWNTVGKSLRLSVLPPFYQTWWFLILAAVSVGGALVAIYQYRVTQLEGRQAAQQAFTRQLIASQEAERKRIAAELHDSLGQSLVIIRNWSMLGSGQLEKDAPAREELDEINTIASRAINEVREIAYNLGPYHLERLGFENSIRDMVKRVTQVSGIAIVTELDAPDGALSSETQMSLYRITQEALNNIVKHSQAGEARVVLKHEPAGVRLTVSDNGKGFNPQNAASPDHSSQAGFGLNSMAERVRLLGGTLNIRSAPSQGTTVETVLPERSATTNGGQRAKEDE